MERNGGQMVESDARRVGAGLSFLFAPGERPDGETLRRAVEGCQASARIVRNDPSAGAAELVASGLTFEIDGLVPGPALPTAIAAARPGLADDLDLAGAEAIRLFPGHHLSGGATLAPVTRALLAVTAELAVSLPVMAVHWHPADIAVEPRQFSRSILAWLAGGTFPASALTALSFLADGSVISRGLAHFLGQEMTLRGAPGVVEADALRLASRVVERLAQTGPLDGLAEMRVEDVLLHAEPARAAKQILVWRAD